ncbi:MAG: Zn2+/Cd2+-exporting ATPase [Thermomicrobiales bacterium]|nr:Zn2+/Cd2+-exporting ATPase [Thermomicrobiales bacterium]
MTHTIPSAEPWVFDVSGMDCGDCARTIEAGVRRLPGVAAADVNFAAGTLTVTPVDSQLNRASILTTVAQAGYSAQPRDAQSATASPTWWRRRRVVETTIAAVLWLVGFAVEQAGVPRIASAVPFLLAMAVAGYPVARAAWFALRARRADMNLLMTIAATGAIAIGEWEEGSSVLILFAIGLTLQTLTVERTRRAIQALVRLAPVEANVRRNGEELRVPVAAVAVGETVVVRPGERVPVDGVVVSGRSAVDQATITGESIPVVVGPDGQVFAGSVNGDGVLEIRSTKPAGDTTLARIIHLVEEAQASRAPAQAFVDRFAAVYTPAVVAAALLLATLVPLVVGDFRDWIFRALVLLVVACPCALVISTPVALVAAIGSASRRGVLFKGGAAIEALAAVRTIAFDKTGTLTAGRPALTDVIPANGYSSDALLAQAAAVEVFASHPIALGIVRAARERSLAIPPATEAESLPGLGARAVVGGESVVVGNRRLFGPLPSSVEQQLQSLESSGKTAVVVGSDRGILGILGVADPVRPATAPAIDALRSLGVRTVMLTGDNRVIAARIATLAGVRDVRAELLPHDKAAAIADLQRTGPVAMVGDGVNDAPALATAEVGIAMGVAGSDVAIEAADVALMGDDLAQLPVAVRLARRTLAIIRQNVAASLLVKLAFIALTFVGVTNLWLAVLADMGMSLLVTVNSLRLTSVGAPRIENAQPHVHLEHATAVTGD